MSIPLFLSIQSSYSLLQLALFQGNQCLQTRIVRDTRASSNLIIYLEDLLTTHGKTLADVDFIAMDAGPGAFTSLRVAIASINGIGFGCAKPLIGVSGLEALLEDGFAQAMQDYKDCVGVVGLLNAYGNDAYIIAAAMQDKAIKFQGCKKIHEVIVDLQQTFPSGTLLMVGNGVTTFEQVLQEAFGTRLVAIDPLQEVPSVERIAILAYQQWCIQQEHSTRITPNYLKSQLFTVNPVR